MIKVIRKELDKIWDELECLREDCYITYNHFITVGNTTNKLIGEWGDIKVDHIKLKKTFKLSSLR